MVTEAEAGSSSASDSPRSLQVVAVGRRDSSLPDSPHRTTVAAEAGFLGSQDHWRPAPASGS